MNEIAGNSLTVAPDGIGGIKVLFDVGNHRFSVSFTATEDGRLNIDASYEGRSPNA